MPTGGQAGGVALQKSVVLGELQSQLVAKFRGPILTSDHASNLTGGGAVRGAEHAVLGGGVAPHTAASRRRTDGDSVTRQTVT